MWRYLTISEGITQLNAPTLVSPLVVFLNFVPQRRWGSNFSTLLDFASPQLMARFSLMVDYSATISHAIQTVRLEPKPGNRLDLTPIKKVPSLHFRNYLCICIPRAEGKINENYIKSPQLLFDQYERCADNRMWVQLAECDKMLNDITITNFYISIYQN